MATFKIFACYQALGVTIQHGSATSIDDALPQLAQRSCDQAPTVRACLSLTIANWLLDLYDRYRTGFSSQTCLLIFLRYSYHHKLIPLLLIFFFDEVEDISKSTIQLWDKVSCKISVNLEDFGCHKSIKQRMLNFHLNLCMHKNHELLKTGDL